MKKQLLHKLVINSMQLRKKVAKWSTIHSPTKLGVYYSKVRFGVKYDINITVMSCISILQTLPSPRGNHAVYPPYDPGARLHCSKASSLQLISALSAPVERDTSMVSRSEMMPTCSKGIVFVFFFFFFFGVDRFSFLRDAQLVYMWLLTVLFNVAACRPHCPNLSRLQTVFRFFRHC